MRCSVTRLIRPALLLQTVFLAVLSAIRPVPARADLPMLDPLARPGTRLGPSYVLALSISVNGSDERDLCGLFPLDATARLALRIAQEPIAPIPLNGLTIAEAKPRIAAVVQRYFSVKPDIRVGIARMPRVNITISGATFRNGPLILAEGARLSDALADVGYLSSADLKHVDIARFVPGGATTHLTVDFTRFLEGAAADNTTDPVLQNGDRIVLPTSPVKEDLTVAVTGEVKRPNALYPWKQGMRVKDALEQALGMLPTADPQKVTISRRRGNTIMIVDADRARENVPTENVTLQPDDTIFVPPKDTGHRYAVVGAVPTPHTVDLTKPVTLGQAIIDAGGFRPNADRSHVVLMKNMLYDPTRAEPVVIDYDKILREKLPDPKLGPGDVVQVPERKRPPSPLLDIGLFILRHLLF